jgi:hypothetical protein
MKVPAFSEYLSLYAIVNKAIVAKQEYFPMTISIMMQRAIYSTYFEKIIKIVRMAKVVLAISSPDLTVNPQRNRIVSNIMRRK